MPNEEQMTITLPPEMARRVRAYLANGRYATELDVLDSALDLLDPEEESFQRWLREEVLPAAEKLKQDPSRGRTPEQVRETLLAAYERAQRAG